VDDWRGDHGGCTPAMAVPTGFCSEILGSALFCIPYQSPVFRTLHPLSGWLITQRQTQYALDGNGGQMQMHIDLAVKRVLDLSVKSRVPDEPGCTVSDIRRDI